MKDLKIYIIIATAFFILYIVAEYNRPKAVDWSETLVDNDKIPFGTYILYHQLNSIFPDANIKSYREAPYNSLNGGGNNLSVYIIICNRLNLNEYDYKKVNDYIKNGNDVFIAASYFGDELKKVLKIQTQSELNVGDTNSTLQFLNPCLDTSKVYNGEKGLSNTYFSSLDTPKAIVLGKNNFNHYNFIKYPIGKGYLYLIANPLMFSNYSLLNKQGSLYASTALSHLKKTKNIFWDEFYTNELPGNDNTMRVFLRYLPLKWAFYIAFFSLATFVIFEMKRRQRTIPVIELLTNSTLDFVTVVGQVYYEKRDNANIARKKILYFLAFLRDEYQVKINKANQELIEKLISKIGLDPAFADEFVDYLQYIENQSKVTDRELIKLNQLIEQFYIKSR